MSMASIAISATAAGCIFGATLAGLALRKVLPADHLSGETKDTVKLGVGMIATLAALVLGLLVNSAKNSLDVLNNGFVNSGAKIVQLDQALERYGPSAATVRERLRKVVEEGLIMLWPEEEPGNAIVTGAQHEARIAAVQEALRQLVPVDDAQRRRLEQVEELAADLTHTRWLMIEQSQSALPTPLIAVVIFWLAMLYLSFGLFAPRNATVIIVLFMCALGVSLAIFMTMEMNRPLSGIVKVSSEPMRAALQSLKR